MFFNEDMTSMPNITVKASNVGLEPSMAGMYRIIAESNEDWYLLREKMMRLEHNAIISEDEYLLNEGAGDFFKRVADFFRKLWAKIKEIWSRFVNWLANAVLTDKAFVKRYERVLRKVDKAGFKYKGWKWNIDAVRIPKGVDFTLKAVANNPQYYAKTSEAEYIVEYARTEENYDNFRGEICGVSKVSSDKYYKKLVDTMRGGEEKKELVPNVGEYLTVIKDANRSIKEIKKDRDAMDKLYAKCIARFEAIAKDIGRATPEGKSVTVRKTQTDSFKKMDGRVDTGYKGGNEEALRNMRAGSSAMADIARRYASIINVAFGAKIEVVKQQRKEYRAVLSKLASYKPKKLNASYDFMSESSVLDRY